jgi:hypothetical protein
MCSCSQDLYIEMAVQGLLGAGVTADGGGDIIAPPHEDAATILRTADLVVIDRDIQSLILDFEILIGLNMVSYVFWFPNSVFRVVVFL